MPPQVLSDLSTQVNLTVGAEQSATVLINGIAGKIQAAVDAATANGATVAELAPVSDLVTQLKSSADALSAAVAANPA